MCTFEKLRGWAVASLGEHRSGSTHARARVREKEDRSRLVSPPPSPLVPVPQVGRPRTRAAARRSPLTHHMPASPGIISLLTYTKAVMPSLPVVLKRILATGWIFEKPWPHHT